MIKPIGYILYHKTGSCHDVIDVISHRDGILKVVIYNKWFRALQHRTEIMDSSIKLVLF